MGKLYTARLAFFFISMIISIGMLAQGPLDRTVSLDIQNQRLDHVLEILSNRAGFYFSYNSNIIKKDSLVNLSVRSRTVKQVLQVLLPDHYEFRESGNYIIIRKTPITVKLVTNKAVASDNSYHVSGYVLDDETGEWIRYASIYEKNQLASTLTNTQGYFRLKLKHRTKPAALTVSKEFYRDTTVIIEPGYNQQITITIMPVTSGSLTIIGPDDYFAPDELKLRVQTDSVITEYTYLKADSVRVERTAVARFLLSSGQMIQSLNLKKFFTSRPFQLSLTPGLSTHGKLSGQVINNFSLNVFGGYNGGVEGLELGGLFNIDKKHVRYLQAAGLFNIVGGRVTGLQAAGVSNTVLDTVTGLQVAGVNNLVKGKFTGLQAGGVYNHVTGKVAGVQIGGVGNFAGRDVKGSQLAGVFNFCNGEITGVQLGGVINYAKHVRGMQIGLINVSDTSEGLGIGLINIVFKGYHKLAFSSNELVNANVAFKTGSRKLYNILQAGMNFGEDEKVLTFGYGLGTEMKLGRTFSLNPEFTAQHLYLGSWDYANVLGKAHLNLNIKFSRKFSIFGGPVFNAYYTRQDVFFPGYKSVIPPAGPRTYDLATNVKGWLGWNAGINFF